MSDLLDRNKLLMHMADIQIGNSPTDPTDKEQVGIYRGNGEMVAAVMQFDSSVKIVRCNDCRYSVPIGKDIRCTNACGLCFPDPDSFCSFGKSYNDE